MLTEATRQRFIRQRPSYLGLVIAAFAYAAALVPSLLPRSLVFLVTLAALGIVGGYALGALISWAVNKIPAVKARPIPRKWSIITVIVAWIAPLVFTPIAITWQSQQQTALDMPSPLPGTFLFLLFTAVVAIIFVLIGRSLRLLTASIAGLLGRIPPLKRMSSTPPRSNQVAHLLRFGVAVILIALTFSFLSSGFAWLTASYDATNADMTGQSRDRVGANSGGDESLVAWETLGRQGRAFVGNPMTPERISQISGEPAIDPLRLYVGMEQAPTPDERSALAVAEIERSGAWDREYLVIFVVTGTGWVDPNAVNAIEVVTGGDVATVAVQYSAVPSWIGFVIDQQTAMTAGASQVRTIVSAWQEQPEDSRPQLVLFGQSLGAFGSQAAWPEDATPEDVVAEIPRVIWVGPPAQSRLWERWQELRTSGPAWQPVIGDGEIATVYVEPGALLEVPPQPEPVITIVAHANDPVVYWSPSIFWREPQWSKRLLGPGVDPHFRWFPGITYLSVGFDLIGGGEPPEVGHNYSANMAGAIATTMGSPGWTTAQTVRLQRALPDLLYSTS